MKMRRDPSSDHAYIIMNANLDKEFEMELPLLISRAEQDLLRTLNSSWNESKRNISTIEIPMSNRMTIITLYYFLTQRNAEKKSCRMLYIVETKTRKNLIAGILDKVNKLYLQKRGIFRSPVEIGLPFLHYEGEKRLAVLTFEEYITGELLKPENLNYIFL